MPALPYTAWHPTPVLTADRPWEGQWAAPFSGGIWQVGGFWRCYYLAGPQHEYLCAAISEDGLTWHKPALRADGSNILLEARQLGADRLDSNTVWYAPHEIRPWKLAQSVGNAPLHLFESIDGVTWVNVGETPPVGDRTTLFFNHKSGMWTYCVRAGMGIASHPRRVDRVESPTFVPTAWNPVRWLEPDAADPHLGAIAGGAAQLYAVDVVPYWTGFLGLVTMWRGQPFDRPKMNEVTLALSLDGVTFLRPWRQGWIVPANDTRAWQFGNVQSVGNGVHVVGDTVRIYVSGRAAHDGASLGVVMCPRGAFEAAVVAAVPS